MVAAPAFQVKENHPPKVLTIMTNPCSATIFPTIHNGFVRYARAKVDTPAAPR